MSHNPSPNQSSNTTRQLTTRPSTCAIKEIECRKLVSKNAKSKEAIYDGIVWCKTQETPSTSRMVIAMEHNERFCPICKAVATFEPDFAMWIPQPAKRFWQHRGRGVCYCGMPMWERMPWMFTSDWMAVPRCGGCVERTRRICRHEILSLVYLAFEHEQVLYYFEKNYTWRELVFQIMDSFTLLLKSWVSYLVYKTHRTPSWSLPEVRNLFTQGMDIDE
jgi:hypothetical protein